MPDCSKNDGGSSSNDWTGVDDSPPQPPPQSPSPVVPHPVSKSVDWSSVYQTGQRFESKDELVKWVKETGIQHNQVLVIAKSSGLDKPVTIACELSGKYRPRNAKQLPPDHPDRKLPARSRKIDCPFKLTVMLSDTGWVVLADHGFHSHDLVRKDVESSSFAGRLTDAQKEYIRELFTTKMRPKNMLTAIQKRFPNSVTKVSQVRAYLDRLRRDKLTREGITDVGVRLLRSTGRDRPGQDCTAQCLVAEKRQDNARQELFGEPWDRSKLVKLEKDVGQFCPTLSRGTELPHIVPSSPVLSSPVPSHLREHLPMRREQSAFEYSPPSHGSAGNTPDRHGVPKGDVSRKNPPGVMSMMSCSIQAITSTFRPDFRYSDRMPGFLYSFVTSWADPRGDNHSGYRAIAECLGLGEDSWSTVRADAFMELVDHFTDTYFNSLSEDARQSLFHRIPHYKDPADACYRFTCESALVVAGCYYAVVVHVSDKGHFMTYLPMRRGESRPPIPQRELWILRLSPTISDAERYVALTMRHNTPLPPLDPQWLLNRHSSVEHLPEHYESRFAMWYRCLPPPH